MAVAGVIMECNPLHKGHAYLLEKIRQAGCGQIVAVLSGSFVQRGEPAAFSKEVRTRALLCEGADLVLELPVRAALSAADGFAASGIALLKACGIMDKVFFGSETGDADRLNAFAAALSAKDTQAAIRAFLSQGLSYPAAVDAALAQNSGGQHPPLGANDVLGISYLRAAMAQNAPFTLHPVKRTDCAGATAIRERLAQKEFPEDAFSPKSAALFEAAMREGSGPVFLSDLGRALTAKLRTVSPQELRGIGEVSEGLENRILSAAACGSLEELLDTAKTKRYPMARIKRILLRAYLDLPGGAGEIGCIRILGMRRSAAPLCAALKEKASLPVIQRAALAPALLAEEIRAQDVWAAFAPVPRPAGADFRDFPVLID